MISGAYFSRKRYFSLSLIGSNSSSEMLKPLSNVTSPSPYLQYVIGHLAVPESSAVSAISSGPYSPAMNATVIPFFPVLSSSRTALTALSNVANGRPNDPSPASEPVVLT